MQSLAGASSISFEKEDIAQDLESSPGYHRSACSKDAAIKVSLLMMANLFSKDHLLPCNCGSKGT